MAENQLFILKTSVMDKENNENGQTTYTFDREEHAEILLNNLSVFQKYEGKKSPLLTDIRVCCPTGNIIPFHSVVLAACSSTIKDSLTSESFVKYANGEFVISGVTSAGVSVLRDFAYGCDVTVTSDNIDEAIKIAKQFKLSDLRSLCKDYLDETDGEDKVSGVTHRAYDVLCHIYDMWQKGELTDLVLQDEDQETELYCHKSCIAAASSVFQDICLMSEGLEFMPIKGLSGNALSTLIGYIYSAKVTIDDDNIAQLFVNSCHFQLPDLTEAACDWLECALDVYNAIGILELAQFVQSDLECVANLRENTMHFIVNHFADIVEKSDEFVTMSVEILREAIMQDKLSVESEEDVFEAVMLWVKHDEERNIEYLPQLLKCVRLEQTTLDFLEMIEQHPLIQKSPSCLEIIKRAKVALDTAPSYKSEYPSEERLTSVYDDSRSDASFSPLSSYEEDFLSQQGWDYEDQKIEHQNRDISYEKTPEKANQAKQTKRKIPRKLEFEDINSSQDFPRRKNNQPDMRFKVNRSKHLPPALNKDGSVDQRTRVFKDYKAKLQTSPDSKQKVYVPLTKGGKPDMRFSINKEIFKPRSVNNESSNSTGPLKKDGTPDMRYKENKISPVSFSSFSSHPGYQPAGPLKKDGTPDKRYAANKSYGSSTSPCSSSSGSTIAPSGPLKKDGTPDKRYAANRSYGSSISIYRSSSGPNIVLKKDGTPDKRYAANRSSGSSTSLFSSSSGSTVIRSGPLKKDGTPDKRYAANRSSGSSTSVYRSSSGPNIVLKKDGTPDKRYAANRSSGSSTSLFSSSSASTVVPGGYGSSASLSSNSSRSTVVPSGYGSSTSLSSNSSRSTVVPSGYGSSTSLSSNSSRSTVVPSGYGSSTSLSSNSSRSTVVPSGYRSYESSASLCSSSSRSTFVASGPLKSDGTPDMRYKANRR